jgi:hypothetical protein
MLGEEIGPVQAWKKLQADPSTLPELRRNARPWGSNSSRNENQDDQFDPEERGLGAG